GEAARIVTAMYERASLRQRVTMSYDPTRLGRAPGPGGQADIADSAAAARQHLSRLAMRIGRDCWGVLRDVCLYDKGLQQIEAERNWPRRSAKLVLRIALEQAASQLGLDAQAEGLSKGRIETWLPERPSMFPGSGQ